MSQTSTREDRQSALDQFANTAPPVSGEVMSPGIGHNSGLPAVFGAQAVAVHRDEARVLQKLKVLASAAGDDWYYRFPVKDKGGKTSWIEGPSIKLANDLARLYGNCEVDCRAQDMGSAILFHARFVDLETGFALTRPFQQRKGASKLGGSDDGRRDDITFQIGASKAIRNVVTNALQTFADFAFAEAKEALVDKIGRDLPKWRTRAYERMSANIDIKRVEAVIGRKADDWLAPDVARIVAMGKAISDGMATWDETFPVLDGRAEQAAQQTGKLDEFAVDSGRAAGSVASTGSASAGVSGELTPATIPRLAMTNMLLGIATDDRPLDDRLERLDVAMRDAMEEQPDLEKFIKEAAQAAAKVAKGEMTLAVARDWLEGLK
jgi:hypothetical protein